MLGSDPVAPIISVLHRYWFSHVLVVQDDDLTLIDDAVCAPGRVNYYAPTESPCLAARGLSLLEYVITFSIMLLSMMQWSKKYDALELISLRDSRRVCF